MKTTILSILLLTLFSSIKSEEQLTINKGIQITDEQRTDYVRKFVLYHFRKAQWHRKFKANACPEFEEVVIIDPETFCQEPNPEPLAPLPPVTLCEINKNYDGCLNAEGEVAPDCDANPKLCEPPTHCDLPGNKFNSECLEEIDCGVKENWGHVKCQYASKCAFKQYKDLDICTKENPCLEDGSLCLTVCDRFENKDKLRCKIEDCDRFPGLAVCEQIKNCKIKRDCKGQKKFTDPRCCPPEICDPGCYEDNNNNPDKDCGPTDPPEKCTWGYALGDVVSELMLEPVQKQIIDDNGMLVFFKCFNQYTKESQKLELQCFKNSLGANYKLLTEAMKKALEERIGSFDNVSYSENDGVKTIEMDNDLKKIVDQENS